MTEKDFREMEMMNRASQRDDPVLGKVGYLNRTAQGVLTRIEGGKPKEVARVARSLKSLFPRAELFDKTPPSHHIIPQEFRNQSKNLGINVDDFTVLLDPGFHRGPHPLYNAMWGRTFDACKDMSKSDARDHVLDFATQMVEVFGWGGAGIGTHRSHLR